jgi:hypothetical protein
MAIESHVHEDDLTLYYYGEGRRRAQIERHLASCDACAAVYRDIAATLSLVVAGEPPERGEQYGLEVWQRIRPHLSDQSRERGGWFGGLAWFSGWSWREMTLAGSVAALVLAAFVTGYFFNSRTRGNGPSGQTLAEGSKPANPANPDAVRRILLTSVADHLDRSERVLTDIMNDPGTGKAHDISTEQRWAEDLLTASRLYRQDAVDAGERSIATVLDDLERNLLEIVHSPSTIGAAELEQIRRRIDAAALLFKVRVLSDDLRQRESAPAERQPSTTSTSKIS